MYTTVELELLITKRANKYAIQISSCNFALSLYGVPEDQLPTRDGFTQRRIRCDPRRDRSVCANTGGSEMKTVIDAMWKLRIWTDNHAQDLIEYALMAGFVAVSAGAIMPGVATSISRVFSKVASTMTAAASQS